MRNISKTTFKTKMLLIAALALSASSVGSGALPALGRGAANMESRVLSSSAPRALAMSIAEPCDRSSIGCADGSFNGALFNDSGGHRGGYSSPSRYSWGG